MIAFVLGRLPTMVAIGSSILGVKMCSLSDESVPVGSDYKTVKAEDVKTGAWQNLGIVLPVAK